MNRSQPSPVTFDKKDVEIIARETLYRGFFTQFIPVSPSLVQWRNEP